MSDRPVGVMVIGTPDDDGLMSQLVSDLDQFGIQASTRTLDSDPVSGVEAGPDHSAVILLWTRAAAAAGWRLVASVEAMKRSTPVVVGVCDSSPPPSDLQGVPVVDIMAWSSDGDLKSLEKLAEAVRAQSERQPEPEPEPPSSSSEPLTKQAPPIEPEPEPPSSSSEPLTKQAPPIEPEDDAEASQVDLNRLRPGTQELLVLADRIAGLRGGLATAADVVLAGIIRPAVSALDPTELTHGAAYGLYAVVPDHRETHLVAALRVAKVPVSLLVRMDPPNRGATAAALSRSPELAVLLAAASKVAIAGGGSEPSKMIPPIYSHHLLGAAFSRASLAPRVTRALTVDEDRLRSAFLGSVRERYPHVDVAYWTALVTRPPGEAVATFNHDDTRKRNLLDEDSLNIEPHVRALALLVTSKVLKPPLAVGLFGDWGSGKTFFMRALRQEVDRLTTEARNSKLPQRDLQLYRNVAQIEFNAWHFVDADLWASLADYIFANLRITEGEKPDEVDQRRQMYVRKLSEDGAAIRQVETERQRLHAQIELSETELLQVRAQARNKLGAEQHARALLSASPALKRKVDDLSERLGVPRVGSSVADLEASLTQARATAVGARSSVAALSGRYGNGWSVLAFAALLLGPFVLWLTTLVEVDGVERWAASAAGFIGGVAAWIRTANGAVSSTVRQIDRLSAALDRQVERDPVVLAQRKSLQSLRDEEARLAEQETRLRGRLAKVEQALRELSPAKLLADFILSRSDSDDYRKHLGLASLIRKDFEALAKHIDDFNDSLESDDAEKDAKPRGGAVASSEAGTRTLSIPATEGPATARPATGAAVEVVGEDPTDVLGDGKPSPSEADYHVNRIVLYIDDLDRCPPETVAKVLQAVHLLLAFPLFVVVVGVDARWLSRSLTKHYEGLLEASESDEHGSASPQDYLEKIFQIPFWLRPMPLDATGHLLSSLTAASPSPGSPAQREGPGVKDGNRGARASDEGGRTTHEQTDADTGITEAAKAEPDKTPSGAGRGSSTTGSTTETDEEGPDYDLRIAATVVTQSERDFMEELRPMLGRSPRSLTRYVNIFRLLKAVERHRLSREGAQTTLDEPVADEPTMFLLAVLTGYPDIAQPLLTELARPSTSDGPAPEELLTALVQRARGGRTAPQSANGSGAESLRTHQAQWDELDTWLREHQAWVEAQDIRTWGSKAQVVARYSFRSDVFTPTASRPAPATTPPPAEPAAQEAVPTP